MSMSMPEAPAPGGKKIYTCGTLRYTAGGLATLFFWLLWGDFFWVLLNSALPGILPLKLNEMGASDTTMAMLVKTMGTAIVFVLCPIVSFKSDRYRSRWGRRIPFLAWSTPLVGLFMVLLGCFEDVTQFTMGDKQQVVIFGYQMSRMAVSLIIFGVLLVGFDVVDIYNDTIYYYLFNDVVPTEFLSRFLALFRMVGTGASLLYNGFLMEHALTSFRLMWIIGGIGYTVAYLMMCFFVKEGQYPPPPENIDKRTGFMSSLKTFFKECFYHPLYWCFFLLNTFFAVSWVAGGLFGTLRNTGSLELSLKELGMMGVYLGPIGILLMYPAGWLADKFNPVRVYFWVTLILVLSNATQVIFIFTDFGPRTNLIYLYAISIVFMPFAALQGAAEGPMYMRLLPKDRYGQFCSANGGLRAFANIFFSIIAGIVITGIGARVADGYKVATNEIGVAATEVVASAWKEEEAGPWEVKYVDNDVRSGTITVPGATAVKVFFKEIRTQHGWDYLSSDAGPADAWSGNFDEAYSSAKTGDTITLNIRSNMATPGNFTITKVSYQGARTGPAVATGAMFDTGDKTFSLSGRVEEDRGKDLRNWLQRGWDAMLGRKVKQYGAVGIPGVTVSFVAADAGQPATIPATAPTTTAATTMPAAPPPVVTDAQGNWTQNGFAKGGTYRVLATKDTTGGTWTFQAPADAFADAKKDIKFGAKFADGSGWTEEAVGPWAIKYQNNWERTGTITVPGATAVKLYYEVLKMQPGVDLLQTDAEGDVAMTGNLEEIYSEAKAGDTIELQLTTGMYAGLASNMRPRRSGDLYNNYEIRVTKVKYLGNKTGVIARTGAVWEDARANTFPLAGQIKDAKDRPVPGAVISFRTIDGNAQAPGSVIADSRGNWCQVGFARGGRYEAAVDKQDIGSTWTFSKATVGDRKYRYYPAWAMVFQIGAIVCLVLMYRQWKSLGGATSYTPPVLTAETEVSFPPATPILSLLIGFTFGIAGIADWIPGLWKLDKILPTVGWFAFAAGATWLVYWWFTRHRHRRPHGDGGPRSAQ